jgi:hypothetical protein
MKSALFHSCALLTLLVASLGAQTARHDTREMTVAVPFDFMIEQTMFPAGKYTVTVSGDHTFYFRANQGLESLGFATQTGSTVHPHSPSLIFAEDKGHYHLHELWMNSSIGGEVSVPEMEQLSSVHTSRVEVPAHCANCE